MACAGLPIGFQLIGRPWQEASLLAAARYVQLCMMLLCTSANKAGAPSMMSVAEPCVRPRIQLPATRYDVLFGKQV